MEVHWRETATTVTIECAYDWAWWLWSARGLTQANLNARVERPRRRRRCGC